MYRCQIWRKYTPRLFGHPPIVDITWFPRHPRLFWPPRLLSTREYSFFWKNLFGKLTWSNSLDLTVSLLSPTFEYHQFLGSGIAPSPIYDVFAFSSFFEPWLPMQQPSIQDLRHCYHYHCCSPWSTRKRTPHIISTALYFDQACPLVYVGNVWPSYTLWHKNVLLKPDVYKSVSTEGQIIRQKIMT